MWHRFWRSAGWAALIHCRPMLDMVFAVPSDPAGVPPYRGEPEVGQPPPGHPESAAGHPPSAAESALWSQIQPM